jgi:hypothetical protein
VLKWPRYYGKYQYQGPDWYESFNKVTSSSMRREEGAIIKKFNFKILKLKKKKNPRPGSGRVRFFQS